MNKTLIIFIVTYLQVVLLSATSLSAVTTKYKSKYDNPIHLPNFIGEDDTSNSNGENNDVQERDKNVLSHAMIPPHPNLFLLQKDNIKNKQHQQFYRQSLKRYVPHAFHAMRGKRTISSYLKS